MKNLLKKGISVLLSVAMLSTMAISGFAEDAAKTKDVLEQKTIKVGSVNRTYLVYIPQKGNIDRPTGVIVLAPNGKTAADCAENSGWKDIAVKNNLVVFFAEAYNGSWNIKGNNTLPSDLDYISAIYKSSPTNPDDWSLNTIARYMVGYGEGGTMGHEFAMANTNSFAGFASIGGSLVPDSYIAAVGPKTSIDDKYTLNKDIPLPVWIINDSAASSNPAVVEYWKSANKIEAAPVTDNGITKYSQTKFADPVNNDPVASVWVSDKAGVNASYDPALASTVYSQFLSKVYRFKGPAIGAMRASKTPEERGAVKITKTIAGLNRYWYEYIPASVKKDPNKKVPLLVASHGSGGNGQTYMAQSEWYEVAEARGFIVVFPTAYPGPDRGKTVWPNWNLQNDPGYVADDVGYIMEILKDTKSKYSIDDSRIYAAGHSMGSMLSFLLGATHPETFAAIAPCSGRVLNKFSGIWKYPGVRYDLVMPIWADMGENENGNIVADDETERTLKHYLAQNHIPDGIVPAVVKTGKYTTETYYDATGKIPLVNYSALENFPHAFIPEMAWKIWDEFLSKYSRNSDGTVNYSGNTDIKAATNPGVKAGTIFNDLKSHWSQMIMVRFASRGLISGFSDGTIKPDEEISKSDFIQLVSKTLDVAPASLEASAASSNKITREDAAAIIYKAGKDRILKGAEDPVKIKDIDQVSASSKSSVEALIKACIIKGNSDGTFRPKNNITRAEAVALLSAFVR